MALMRTSRSANGLSASVGTV